MTDEQQGSEGQPAGQGGSPNGVEDDSVQSPSDFLQESEKSLWAIPGSDFYCGWFTHEAWHDILGEGGCRYGDMCHWYAGEEVAPGMRRFISPEREAEK